MSTVAGTFTCVHTHTHPRRHVGASLVLTCLQVQPDGSKLAVHTEVPRLKSECMAPVPALYVCECLVPPPANNFQQHFQQLCGACIELQGSLLRSPDMDVLEPCKQCKLQPSNRPAAEDPEYDAKHAKRDTSWLQDAESAGVQSCSFIWLFLD